jgi:glycosyltransferase involved in cell wall biosynthesis
MIYFGKTKSYLRTLKKGLNPPPGDMRLKILIISDAWKPQINGVVRSLEQTSRQLAEMGQDVRVVGPDSSRPFTLAMPFYPEIKLELFAGRRLERTLRDVAPDFIHIATEGPLGRSMRRLCLRQSRAFTTSYHTRFPEYLAARVPRPLQRPTLAASYTYLRRFHAPAGAVMVATSSMEKELRARKFRHIVRWSRGVDTDLFRPYDDTGIFKNLPRPVLLYVGRVAVEKNLRAFLELKTEGSLVVVGDGPDLPALKRDYGHAHFLGAMEGESLARHYAAADLFVFPSLTDTFGLVLLEACAAGLRIAACPAPGPSDIFIGEEAESFSALDADLGQAVKRALALPKHPALPRDFAASFSWRACARQFFTHLQAPSPQTARKLRRWRKRIGEM